MTKRCPIGSHREGRRCVPVKEDNISERVYPAVRDFAQAYQRGDWNEAKKHRLRIEKIAGKGAMPSYPSESETTCPRKLAKEIACASKMIKSGKAKGYQANAVCRASIARTQCHICKGLPCKK